MAPAEPSATDLMHLDLAVRLGAELWALLWDVEDGAQDLLAGLLRLAYGRGYYDALTERRRGQLCLDHGFLVPIRGRRS